MIHYLVTKAHAYTMRTYLETWQRDMLGRVSFEYYEDLPYWHHIAGGAYIFSDLERLNDAQLELAEAYCEQLLRSGARVLNRPRKVLLRYELLKRLREKGINGFGVRRLSESREGMRYPVFVREENEHTGNLSGLIEKEAGLEPAISAQLAAGKDARRLLIVEYFDTADADGVFRKYSVIKVGNVLIPRHLLFSGGWMIKYPGDVDSAKTQEEDEFLRLNPHVEPLRRIFELANIDYGRADYTLHNGKVTVWEINTNPVVMPVPGHCNPDRLPGQARSSQKIGEALDAIDTPTNGHVIDLNWEPRLMRALGIGPARQATARIKRRLRRLTGNRRARPAEQS